MYNHKINILFKIMEKNVINKFLKQLEEQQVKFVDFRFTDILGAWHHMSFPVEAVDEKLLEEGIYFDGSSISGWRQIHESDMIMKPDFSSIHLDPFSVQSTMIVVCDIVDPRSGKPYTRDPRSIGKKAEAYLKESGFATTAYFGPEAEFFVFDGVRYGVDSTTAFYELESEEFQSNNCREINASSHGHRPLPKGGYFPVAPLDSLNDMRAEMVTVLQQMGLTMEKHHHEVAPAQHELGFQFGELVETGDNIQIYKYAVRNVAHSYGKTATFMPKPIFGDNGSGMHVHQSLWKDGKPLFAGGGYSGLSETALYYIGGILKHAKAINAFTNPTTNSYKRLVPGYEAPVILAYSAQNRSAACRIPTAMGEKAKRVEIRFPDPLANPYLGNAVMLMAGLDGIRHQIHPGEPSDHNLFEELDIAVTLPNMCGSLREALEALAADHEFLLDGDVFTKDFIQGYMDLKWQEVLTYERTPHPLEFMKYYSW